jgi:hypothetical protein
LEHGSIMKQAQRKTWEALSINIPITQKFTAIPKFCSFFSLAFNLFSSTQLSERTAQLLHNIRWNYIWKLQANTTHKTAICCKPHNSSNQYSRITRQFGYKHFLSKCHVHKKFSLYYCTNITCLNVGLLMICKVFSFSCNTLYRWVMTNCCFMSNMRLSCTELHPNQWKLAQLSFQKFIFCTISKIHNYITVWSVLPSCCTTADKIMIPQQNLITYFTIPPTGTKINCITIELAVNHWQ